MNVGAAFALDDEPIAASPAVILKARAEARALLWRGGEFDLHEAVDKLQADAEACGLVDQLGQDAVQEIMSNAFAGAR